MKDDESVYIDPSLDIRAPFTISSRWRGGRSREIRSEIAGETRGACRFMRWNVTRTPQRCDGALENCCPVSAGISSSRILVILDTDVSETSQTSNEKRRGRFWHEKRSIINRVMIKKCFFYTCHRSSSSSIRLQSWSTSRTNFFRARLMSVRECIIYRFVYETCIRLISNWRARKHCDSTVRLNSAEFRTVLHGKIIIRFTRAVNPINSVHFSIELTR